MNLSSRNTSFFTIQEREYNLTLRFYWLTNQMSWNWRHVTLMNVFDVIITLIGEQLGCQFFSQKPEKSGIWSKSKIWSRRTGVSLSHWFVVIICEEQLYTMMSIIFCERKKIHIVWLSKLRICARYILQGFNKINQIWSHHPKVTTTTLIGCTLVPNKKLRQWPPKKYFHIFTRFLAALEENLILAEKSVQFC